ncbi:MAG: superoxide dismutase, Ni [Chloroflexota bacterium]
MLYHVLTALDKRFNFERAKAHCDIPCGIYDPMIAQIAALTVVRMIDLAVELDGKASSKDLAYQNTMARYITTKEEHAEKVKHEVRVIWGDYIKPQHIEKYPQLHALAHEIMALGSKARQTVDRGDAVKLVEKVNEFAQIFWETKGVATKRAKAPYAPALELVYPAL